MEFPEAATEPLRELHRAQQKRARPCYAMRQKPPFERLIVVPDRVSRIHQETLIVTKDINEHQSEDAKQQVLWAYPWKRSYSSRQS
jgi:hypothetical protein